MRSTDYQRFLEIMEEKKDTDKVNLKDFLVLYRLFEPNVLTNEPEDQIHVPLVSEAGSYATKTFYLEIK